MGKTLGDFKATSEIKVRFSNPCNARTLSEREKGAGGGGRN